MLEEALKTLNSTLLDVSFWIGLAVVFIFFRGRFNELRSDLEELDPPVLTRSFTTRFRFQLASLTYCGLYAFVYLVLICIGSIEEIQQYLIAWIGQIEGETIGTPAWAVLAVTAVLPSLPWFQDLDKAVRERLEDFASIPAKVRWLAQEVVGGLAAEVAPSSEAEAGIFSEAVLMGIYEKLKKRIDQLKASPHVRAGRAYTNFFGRHDAFQDRLDKQFNELAEAEHGGDGGAFRRQGLEHVVRRLSRYLVCAVLHVEPNEYQVRTVLAHELGIKGISIAEWRFKSTQVMLGMIIVIVATIMGTALSVWSFLGLSPMSEDVNDNPMQTLIYFMMHGLRLSFLLVPMYMLPFMLAAGVQMYLLDRKAFGEDLEWDGLTVALVLTFIGCFGFALLPALLAMFLGAGADGAVGLQQVAPWAIAPAFVGVIFVVVSRMPLTPSRRVNFVIDVLAHGMPAGVAGALAATLAFEADFFLPGVPTEYLRIAAPLTSALIGGSLGGLQCFISRPGGNDTHMAAPA